VIERYPGSDERERELEDLAVKSGGSIVEIGKSVGGRAIRGVRVASTSTSTSAPKVLVNANIHGPEWIGSRVAMGVLRAVAEGHAIRSRAEVVVVPCINVDGYARVEACSGRGSLKELRCNDNGVDLNRNFPVPSSPPSNWIVRNISVRFGGSGSGDPKSAAYRGPQPSSEPEVRALDAFCEREKFVACVSLHSFMGTFIPPCVRTASEASSYAKLARIMRRAQTNTGYVRLANRFVDVLTGELEDRLHHDFGCWAITLECFAIWQSIAQHLSAPSLFWRFNPREPALVEQNDVPAVLAFLDAALDMPHPRRR
jgi:predicted deacylase